jgi:hypothetical protein
LSRATTRKFGASREKTSEMWGTLSFIAER